MKAKLSRIRKVNFDVCTVCNHTCHFCPNLDPRTPKHVLPAEDFERVMDDVSQTVAIEELGLSAKGEPIMNPQLEDIISLAKKKYGIGYVYISTNGSLLNQSLLERLLDAGLDSIKLSINAFDRESYRTIHGKDHFERVMRNLAHIVELKKERQFRLLASVVSDLSEAEVLRSFEQAAGESYKGIDLVIPYMTEYREGVSDCDSSLPTSYPPCSYLFGKEVYIDPRCELVPCCNDYFAEISIGNLLESSLAELWNNEAYTELRAMHLEQRLPKDHICYRCLANSGKMTQNDKGLAQKMKKDDA